MRLSSEQGDIEVSDEVFGCPINDALVHQVVVSYMAGGRQGSKSQKNRSDVSGGGKKPWRQKGTGRARAGTSRSPIWRSGGVTFAAKPRDFSQKVNKKMYRRAMCCILSELARSDRIVVVSNLSVSAPKTSHVLSMLKGLSALNALLLVSEPDNDLMLGARNLPNVLVKVVNQVDPVSLLSFEKVVLTQATLQQLEAQALGKVA